MIAIYGATGTTGRLIAAALVDRGHEVRLCGRDAGRLAPMAEQLGGLAYRAAPVHDAHALRAALDGARVVVSCAGPFLQVGEPVLTCAIDGGAHYLDTAGEQAFVRLAYERHDAPARRAGVVAVPATGFEAALGDWAAALVAAALPGDGPLDELAIAYALERVRPTAGTQGAALASLAAPSVVWEEDRWIDVGPGAHGRSFGFPPPLGARDTRSFPSAEVVTVPRHVAARRVEAFASFGTTALARAGVAVAALAAPLLPALLASPLGDLLRAHAAAARPADAGLATPASIDERRDARFAIVVEGVRSFRRARLAIAGGDPYAVTATIVAMAASALAAGELPRAGVLAPAEAFPAARYLPVVAAAADLTLSGDAAPTT